MNEDENKSLLIEAICEGLPYGLKLDFYSKATNEHYVCTLLGIEPEGEKPIIAKVDSGAFKFTQDHVKPYLRPMMSMTEQEVDEYKSLCTNYEFAYFDNPKSLRWLKQNRFDYLGLIEYDLAIAVTKENNPYENG